MADAKTYTVKTKGFILANFCAVGDTVSLTPLQAKSFLFEGRIAEPAPDGKAAAPASAGKAK